MKYVLLLLVSFILQCRVQTDHCVGYWDETNKLIGSQRCLSNYTSCCGMCHIRFCCSVLNPFLPILDQSKCDNNVKKLSGVSGLNGSIIAPKVSSNEEADNYLDPFTNYGITVGVFVGITFLISLFFICVACCIIYQRRRMQDEERRYTHAIERTTGQTLDRTNRTTSAHTNQVFFSNNSHEINPIDTVTQMPVLVELNNNNNTFKTYNEYDDLPPAYSTLKFN